MVPWKFGMYYLADLADEKWKPIKIRAKSPSLDQIEVAQMVL